MYLAQSQYLGKIQGENNTIQLINMYFLGPPQQQLKDSPHHQGPASAPSSHDTPPVDPPQDQLKTSPRQGGLSSPSNDTAPVSIEGKFCRNL